MTGAKATTNSPNKFKLFLIGNRRETTLMVKANARAAVGEGKLLVFQAILTSRTWLKILPQTFKVLTTVTY